jgi:MFS family permease
LTFNALNGYRIRDRIPPKEGIGTPAHTAPRFAWFSPPVRLLVSIGLFWMGLYLYVPLLTPIVTHVTGSAGFAGLVVASYGVPQLLTRAVLALWSDRLGRRAPFILAGLLLVTISSVGMAAWPTGAGFLAFRTLAGLAASTWAMFSIQYSAYFDTRHTAQAMGWVSFANNGGQILAVLGGGLLAARFGDFAPFWVSAGVGVIGALLAATVPDRSRPAGTAVVRPRLHGLLRERDVLAASCLGIAYQAGTFVTTFGYVPLWGARHGLGPASLGLLTAVSLVPAAGATVLAGSWAAKRWPLDRILAAGFLLIAVFTVATPFIGGGIGLFVAQGLAGVGRGLLAPTLMALAIRHIAQDTRTTALATYQSLYAVGMVAGPAVAAVLVHGLGLGGVFVGTGALSLLGAGLSLWLPDRSQAAAEPLTVSR